MKSIFGEYYNDLLFIYPVNISIYNTGRETDQHSTVA